MNLIKALLIRTALCFIFNDEILLFKCNIPLCENNVEMFTDAIFVTRIRTIKNDCQIINYAMTSTKKILYIEETEIFYIPLNDAKVSQKILEAIKYEQQQSFFILEFRLNSKTFNFKLCFKLIKALNQTSMDIIELSSKGDQVKVQNIKDILSKYCREHVELIDKHKFSLDADFFKRHAEFKPLYFSTYLECFEALKSFLRPLNFLKIVKNYDRDIEIKGKTIKKSQVIKRLRQKFEEDFKNLDNGKNYEKLYSIFKGQVNVALVDWMDRNLLIPIVSKFDIDRLINNTYSMLHSLFVELQKRPNWVEDEKYPENLGYEILDNLKFYAANELFKFIENDTARPRNISKFYSITYDNKPECNVLDLEKIVCDYNNLMESILNANINNDPHHYHNLNYISPLIDCEDGRFIKAFTILVDHGIKSIKAHNVEGYEVTLTENFDYFIFKHNSRSMYAFPYERIKKQEINKIEVIYKSAEGHLRYSKKILHIDFVMSKVTKIENK